MTKDEALKMCLEYIETDAHERKYVRHAIKESLAQPEQTTGNILMDSYKAMQSMKVEGPRHVVCQCDKCMAQPEPPPECKTEAEKTAYAFGWFKSMEAQRKPLTDDEIQKCYETTGHYQTLRPQDRFAVLALARAIEAAHGIKGEA